MALARASGGDVLTTTISRGSDPSTTPLTAGILGYRFSAFWLRGRAFDITLKTAEDAAKLANIGFDYDQELKPLTLLGAKTVHVSIFVSVEYPDEDLVDILKTYGDLKTENLRRLYFKEPGFTHVENGVRVAQYSKITKDMPRKIVVGGIEIGFKYSGQPTTCYRCHSTEHVVKDCPQGRNRAPNAWRRGGAAPVLPPPPVPPVQENPEPAETADSADRAETLPSGNGSPELFSPETSTAADVSPSEEMEATPTSSKRKAPPPHSDSEDDMVKKGNFADTESSDPEPEASPSPPPPEDKSYKLFIAALQKSGWERSKLMTVIPGVSYYRCRGLFLHHCHGDWSKDKARSVRPGDKDAENWKAFKGFIQQDAFALLLKEFKDLRARYHIFSSS